MAVGTKKYNPGFLSDDEIVASFCVRIPEFESLLESLLASHGNSNVHSLVIGPRGSGKTHLLLRVAVEIRRDASLSEFYPIVFAEESYEVATVGEFWLECLNHLAEQAPECERANLRLSYKDLRTTREDRDLAGRCLGTILDFAGRHGKPTWPIPMRDGSCATLCRPSRGLSCWAALPVGLTKSTIRTMHCTTSFG